VRTLYSNRQFIWFNTFLPAVVGILCFLLAAIPTTPFCYEFPMGAIGKIYASSMLVLLNNRMILGSEEPPSAAISVMKFDMAPNNNKGKKATESHSGEFSVDTEDRSGSSRSCESSSDWAQ